MLNKKYLKKNIIIKSSYLLPTKITVAHFDEKPVFRPNLALLKGPKWSFGQNWTYLIWPNLVWDSHSAHNQYLVSRFLGEFRVLKNCFQPGVYIKQLLNENILHAAPISTLIEITVLLEETWNRVMEIGEVEDEEEQDWDYNIRMRVCLKPPFLKYWLILHQLQNTAFFCVIF